MKGDAQVPPEDAELRSRREQVADGLVDAAELLQELEAQRQDALHRRDRLLREAISIDMPLRVVARLARLPGREAREIVEEIPRALMAVPAGWVVTLEHRRHGHMTGVVGELRQKDSLTLIADGESLVIDPRLVLDFVAHQVDRRSED